jgi:hypothetical protein
VRAINTLLITRRIEDSAKIKFPRNGIVYRGGGLPEKHRDFFSPGRKYRVPGFLAASFSRDVAECFLVMATQRVEPEPPVLWIIRVDPAGEHSMARRCMHVNYVERTNVAGEEEYLFAPYAPFKVTKVTEPAGNCMQCVCAVCVCARARLCVYAFSSMRLCVYDGGLFSVTR